MIIGHRGNLLLYSLLTLFNVFMNLTMGISVIGGNWLRTKSDFIFVRLSSLKSDISLKLNKGLDLLRKGSNWYPHRVMGNL